MLLLTAMLKYWRVTGPLAALIIGLWFFNSWVQSEKAEAVAQYERQAEIAKAEQLAIDEQIIYEQYKENGTINDYVDRMLADEAGGQSEQAEIITDDSITVEPVISERVLLDDPEEAETNSDIGLLSTQENTRPAERNTASTDMGASDELSIEEIDAIRKYSDLLQ